MSTIQLKAVNKTYRVKSQVIQALQNVNFSVQSGEIFGVIGYSGAGKSTLIRLINLLERPDSGQILIDDVEITQLSPANLRQLRHRIGMIFQHFNLLVSRTVADNVRLPLELVSRQSPAEQNKRVAELLDLVGLSHCANHYPRQLSGGQKQRVGIARALANDPDILLCDEATSALDPQTTHGILDLIAKINRQLNLTVVLITHEMDVIRRIADKVAVLHQGRIIETGDVLDLFLHPKKTVTRRMIGQLEHLDELIDSKLLLSTSGEAWRLTFIGQAVSEPVLNNISRNFSVQFSILQGSVARLKDKAYGQLVVVFQGDKAVLEQTRDYLTAQGVTVEKIPKRSHQWTDKEQDE